VATKDKFWAKWKEEEITDVNFPTPENTPLSRSQANALVRSSTEQNRENLSALIAGGELLVNGSSDRLLVSLLRHDRLLD